jgi:Mg-chelatase subunit ChlI
MSKQLLHLVFGGRISDPETRTFEDVNTIDIVGMYTDYNSALEAWRGKAQATIDDAQMRYFIVHLHRMFDPVADEHPLTPDKIFDIKIRRPSNDDGDTSNVADNNQTSDDAATS